MLTVETHARNDLFSCVGVATLKANSPDERNTQPGHRNNKMQFVVTLQCFQKSQQFMNCVENCLAAINYHIFSHSWFAFAWIYFWVSYIFFHIHMDTFCLCMHRFLHLHKYILGLYPDMGGRRGDAWTPTPRWASEQQISHICNFWICQLTNTNAKS